ncbi:UNVERIFIED_CONTAM: Retrovirus-related Pol polyprotein from type-2 retrotransposable element R2DM [Sesamum radiatum]|uniref:Retrovirus-related Pol polyprotein from type-2 retrotransposable element R2DM n=1 Tax=Sesamum radiatum TaxID=300843 RepID=A0AAW2NAM3_SESRA
MPTLEEVREAVFSIDRIVLLARWFGAVFFHTCWEVVFEDVFDAVIKFFHGVEMSKGFTATTISLIPKMTSPTCWSEYQSISLCNVTNKICTKLMTIRLGRVLLKVLSLSQSGFVPRRLFSDNVLLAQELIYSLESRRPEANVVFKLDMAKAYDRVGWEFHFQVLRRKGFPQCWIDLVANAVSHCWFSVLVNGEHAEFFYSTHGLRQEDPLSPVLFVLAADYLMRGLDRLFAAYPMMYYQAFGWIRVSHLAYADDLMIFTTMCRWNMELLRDFLRTYERVSGQLINGMKSFFIVGRQVSSLQTQAVQYVLGYPLKHLPITYLGVPLYKGDRKVCLFDSIISHLRDMLQDWAMTNLSPCLDSKCVAGHSVASASGDSPPQVSFDHH